MVCKYLGRKLASSKDHIEMIFNYLSININDNLIVIVLFFGLYFSGQNGYFEQQNKNLVFVQFKGPQLIDLGVKRLVILVTKLTSNPLLSSVSTKSLRLNFQPNSFLLNQGDLFNSGLVLWGIFYLKNKLDSFGVTMNFWLHFNRLLKTILLVKNIESIIADKYRYGKSDQIIYILV